MIVLAYFAFASSQFPPLFYQSLLVLPLSPFWHFATKRPSYANSSNHLSGLSQQRACLVFSLAHFENFDRAKSDYFRPIAFTRL